MKMIRSLFVLLFAGALAGSIALADHHESKKSDAKPAKAACGCAVGKDGKVCGVDKDCCCSGEKAKKGKAEDKKPEADKPAEKTSAKAGEKAGAACAPCDTCKA